MKRLLKTLLTFLLIPLTCFSAIFTLLWTVGTLLTWGTTDTRSKIMTFVFVISFIILLSITSMLLKQYRFTHFSKPTDTISPTKKEMTGLEFEHYCAKFLMKKGFKEVTVTPPSGDYGADLVAYDKKGNLWVFQCKHYKGKVSNSAVQEAVAAKAHYKADKAGVMTNSQLTKQARELAIENKVLLYELLSD